MKLELIPISEHDTAKVWENIRNGSPIQSVIHNELVSKIQGVLTELKTVSPDNLIAKQAEIKAYETLLGIIHRKDKKSAPNKYTS